MNKTIALLSFIFASHVISAEREQDLPNESQDNLLELYKNQPKLIDFSIQPPPRSFDLPEDYLTIHSVNFSDINLKNEGIRQFLIDGGLLKYDIPEGENLKIINLQNKKGSYTKFLYQVNLSANASTDHQAKKLIIKGIYNPKDPSQEAQNLIYLHQQEKIKSFPSERQNAPKIAIDSLFYSYISTENEDKKEYISVLKKLPGKNLDYYLKDHKFPSDSRRILFEKVGISLGIMHYHFATPETKEKVENQNFREFKTVNHQDFKDSNILYNLKTQQVGFIDLERMGRNYEKPLSFDLDIDQLQLSLNQYQPYSQTKKDLINLINGYVQAYPENIRQGMKKYLNDQFF